MNRCHNCGKYYPEGDDVKIGICSDKCEKEYLEYLNEGLNEY